MFSLDKEPKDSCYNEIRNTTLILAVFWFDAIEQLYNNCTIFEPLFLKSNVYHTLDVIKLHLQNHDFLRERFKDFTNEFRR